MPLLTRNIKLFKQSFLSTHTAFILKTPRYRNSLVNLFYFLGQVRFKSEPVQVDSSSHIGQKLDDNKEKFIKKLNSAVFDGLIKIILVGIIWWLAYEQDSDARSDNLTRLKAIETKLDKLDKKLDDYLKTLVFLESEPRLILYSKIPSQVIQEHEAISKALELYQNYYDIIQEEFNHIHRRHHPFISSEKEDNQKKLLIQRFNTQQEKLKIIGVFNKALLLYKKGLIKEALLTLQQITLYQEEAEGATLIAQYQCHIQQNLLHYSPKNSQAIPLIASSTIASLYNLEARIQVALGILKSPQKSSSMSSAYYENAAICYDLACSHDNTNAFIHSNYGYLLDMQNKFKQAEKEHQIAFQFAPHNPWILNGLGYHYKHLGDMTKSEQQPQKAYQYYQLAHDYYTRALQLEPENVSGLRHRAELLIAWNRLETQPSTIKEREEMILADLNHAARLEPSNPRIFITRGSFFKHQAIKHSTTKSIAYREKALKDFEAARIAYLDNFEEQKKVVNKINKLHI